MACGKAGFAWQKIGDLRVMDRSYRATWINVFE
jgi:hypothetical protein